MVARERKLREFVGDDKVCQSVLFGEVVSKSYAFVIDAEDDVDVALCGILS